MIRVLIKTKEDTISNINITGHADSDESGKDLVCAGVSTSAVGILNALVKFDFLEEQMGTIEVRDGYIDIEVFKSDDTIQVILETLITILETLEESNQKYIKLSKVEV